jgi:hypothetical protein
MWWKRTRSNEHANKHLINTQFSDILPDPKHLRGNNGRRGGGATGQLSTCHDPYGRGRGATKRQCEERRFCPRSGIHAVPTLCAVFQWKIHCFEIYSDASSRPNRSEERAHKKSCRIYALPFLDWPRFNETTDGQVGGDVGAEICSNLTSLCC